MERVQEYAEDSHDGTALFMASYSLLMDCDPGGLIARQRDGRIDRLSLESTLWPHLGGAIINSAPLSANKTIIVLSIVQALRYTKQWYSIAVRGEVQK